MITKSFYRWLAQKISSAQEDNQDQLRHNLSKFGHGQAIPAGHTRVYDEVDATHDLHFRMSKAENGYVMSVRHTDRKTERSNNTLYLIADHEDLGQSISHIITVESLKIK